VSYIQNTPAMRFYPKQIAKTKEYITRSQSVCLQVNKQ